MVHQYTCSACAFQVRSDDDGEVIELVRNHADRSHGIEVAPRDVRDGWEEVELPADD
jgi:predicted small metal-binding protein